ncbi:MAG TPA: sialate O-acetylesterase [Methyloceanibacter sp.]|nr:sialate O-acetylesterase [Methyloceanibacter sp.]
MRGRSTTRSRCREGGKQQTPSADFVKGSGFMYETLTDVYAASGQGPASVVLWHQGEADQGSQRATDPAVYKARVLELIDNLKADGLMKESAPFIVGGLCKPNAADIDQALRELAEENEGIYHAPVNCIPCNEPHFTGAGLVTLGFDRYWTQYRQAVGLTPQSRPLGDNGGTTGKH